ncbi:thiamine pyrophosphate-requiring protein [Streptomyces sp. RB6PN25]|uniref:Thiamine pyrophosphate-requiring protein n=1 Tax=Streptomyces humicola TaxID=2953240 RepID=A0ABT1Q1B5_9ACTN|nr:thiamine pyrophosphate-requiring protein [Streptomyces humicola]MCQ4083730.1 thiamine pyrophosphate-requiring protein [Streptomyces humicola]
MSTTVADQILTRLREWGVTHVFGHPGEGINGLLAAWSRAGSDPHLIEARHEESCAFQAVGYAKFSGLAGVCTATSGPGAIHLLGGMFDAKLDHVPLVTIVGQADRGATGGPYQRNVDLNALFRDVAADFLETVTAPDQLSGVLDRAIRTAYGRRCPTAVIVPADVQFAEYAPSAREFTMDPATIGTEQWAPMPDSDALEHAAEVLNSGRKVAILAGQGAAGARAEVEQVADVLGAGVAKALLGKDVLSDELPYVTGLIGMLGTRPAYDLMRGCDTLLTIGSDFPYTRFLPAFGEARGVQIDIDPHRVGMGYPYEVNLVGDARITLQRLLPKLRRKPDRGWQEQVIADTRRWQGEMERRAALPAEPVNPEHVARELDPLLPEDAVLTCDPGPVAAYYARHLRIRGTMRASLSGTLASAGSGVPYAIGAKFACPDRPAIALAGDHAMQMSGLAELITAARYRDAWKDPRLVVGVWNGRGPGRTVPDVSYAAFAASLGLTGIRVTEPEEVAGAWRSALDADGPAVVEFLTGDVT